MPKPIKNLKESIHKNIDVLTKTFDEQHLETLEKIISIVTEAIRNKKKILLCGNGGSAADSQHVAAEFIGRFKKERKSYPAIALTTDTSILTAVGNDYSFEEIFSRQVEGLGEAGDVLIGISTSGNSPNVLKAVQVAEKRGMKTIGFTGTGGGTLGTIADVCFAVESDDTPYIQAGHLIALHTMCETVENILL
ncbi:MAG: SIS domain-containing protein [Candidatus Omnitrophota bacterium]